MGPFEPPEEGIFSKILFFGILGILIVIMGACAYFIYGYLAPQSNGQVLPTPTPTGLPTPTVVVTPTPTPTPRPEPTLQIEPTAEVTPVPVVDYQFDTRITDALKVVMPPGVWDHYVVYDELVSDNNYKVHIYDFKNLQDEVIATGNVRSYGSIGNGKVAVIYGGDYSIKLYDLSSRGWMIVSPSKVFPRTYPHIFNDYLIYTGNEGGYNQVQGKIDIYSLYAYRFSDGLNSMWAVNIPDPSEPRGDGNNIVWWQISGSDRSIVLFDIKKTTTKVIATGNCDHPRIAGQYVVYHNGADNHIYLYDITSGNTRKLTVMSRQYSTDISGTKIVYDDNRNGNWDIYLLDLSTGKETQITNEPHDQMSPQISGSNIIYMDNRNSIGGCWDIYTIRI